MSPTRPLPDSEEIKRRRMAKKTRRMTFALTALLLLILVVLALWIHFG